MITPKSVPIVSITGILGLVACGALAWQVKSASDAETQRDCERAVAVRVDARSMWLYVVDTADADPARVKAFVEALNEKLPPLKCVGGNAVPDKP